MTSRPALRCLPGGLSDRLPPALLSLASGDAATAAQVSHEDRLALAAWMLAGVREGEVPAALGLWLADQCLDRKPPAS
jgi:hypothetical protein